MLKAYEIIATPAQWVTGIMFAWRDEAGEIKFHSKDDNCYCALGAIRKKHGLIAEPQIADTEDYKADVHKLAQNLAPGIKADDEEATIATWNDFLAKSHAVVHAKLVELDI